VSSLYVDGFPLKIKDPEVLIDKLRFPYSYAYPVARARAI
jgi:hypothetical protein